VVELSGLPPADVFRTLEAHIVEDDRFFFLHYINVYLFFDKSDRLLGTYIREYAR
jgi:hypothetical protein